MIRIRQLLICVAALWLTLITCGCTSVTMPWEPPSGAVRSQQQEVRPVVAMGPFGDPAFSPMEWSGVGAGMSAAIQQKLAQRSDLHLRIEPPLVQDVEQALMGPGNRFNDSIRRVASRYPGVRYVLVGRVLEFKHAAVAGAGASQRSASRNQHQALVTVKVDVVDLRERRLALSEQFESRVWASDEPMSEAYQGVKFGSHRFWELPLGLASQSVAGQAAARMNVVAPLRNDEPIRIVDRLTERRVAISSNAVSRVTAGDLLYVCVYDSSGVNLVAVNDPATGQPLRAKVEPRVTYPSAWLMGEPPPGLKLREAVLVQRLPEQRLTSAR